jgi:catechol 2,3-dioxygenase-like lactoylglutathione lyase family enzyme
MRLDHVAHTCRDPHATHRFYHDLLGLNLVQAYGGRELMLLYELPGGGSLAFITADHVPVDTDEASWERRHIGLGVNTREEFDSWLQRLQASGIKYRLVENERIYFADPDGLVLEIEVAAPMAPNPAACDVLAHWRK